MNVTCRLAVPDDAEAIHRFIIELAEYENGRHLVRSTPQILREQMMNTRPPFECVIAELNGTTVGFALFFQNYSTWEAKPGLYLEDLYVTPEARKYGVGRAIFDKLTEIAEHRGYARLDWMVLDWNDLAIKFYDRIGATPLADWTSYRLNVPLLCNEAA